MCFFSIFFCFGLYIYISIVIYYIYYIYQMSSSIFAKRGREPSIREEYALRRAVKIQKKVEKHFDDKKQNRCVVRQHDCGLRMRTCPSTNMLVVDSASSAQSVFQNTWKCFNCEVIFDNDDEYFIMCCLNDGATQTERLISVCGYCYDIPAVRKLATTPLSLKHFCDGCGRFNRVEGFKHWSYCVEFDEDAYDAQRVVPTPEDAYLLHKCPEGTSIHRGLYYEKKSFKCLRCDVVVL